MNNETRLVEAAYASMYEENVLSEGMYGSNTISYRDERNAIDTFQNVIHNIEGAYCGREKKRTEGSTGNSMRIFFTVECEDVESAKLIQTTYKKRNKLEDWNDLVSKDLKCDTATCEGFYITGRSKSVLKFTLNVLSSEFLRGNGNIYKGNNGEFGIT